MFLMACSTTGEVMVPPYQNQAIKAEPTVIERQLMDEQNATTLPEVLKNVPSITR
jgi:outer membrane cobalamin receptor